MYRYFVLYKPFGCLSQFTREHPDHQVLGDLFEFPPGVYPVGRLDKDSEGLLLLTDDKSLNHKLLDPAFQHPRTYFVQVEGEPNEAPLHNLSAGVNIRVNKRPYFTKPAQAISIPPPTLPPRNPPIRFRKNIPTSWLSITLTEGKNRQVRRMCAAVGYPVLRLVRASIVGMKLGQLQVGEVLELQQAVVYQKLHLRPSGQEISGCGKE